MARVYVSVGSNVDRERNVKAGLDGLSAVYGELRLSSVFESEPVGFEGDPFYNLAVGLDTSQPKANSRITVTNTRACRMCHLHRARSAVATDLYYFLYRRQ